LNIYKLLSLFIKIRLQAKKYNPVKDRFLMDEYKIELKKG